MIAMTLCKYRPQRTYCAQWIIEKDDVGGLMKSLDATIDGMGEAGLASTPYYVGARLALSTLFDVAQRDGDVDTWVDFMREFEAALEELEGGD